jgi:hypothetical protein
MALKYWATRYGRLISARLVSAVDIALFAPVCLTEPKDQALVHGKGGFEVSLGEFEQTRAAVAAHGVDAQPPMVRRQAERQTRNRRINPARGAMMHQVAARLLAVAHLIYVKGEPPVLLAGA